MTSRLAAARVAARAPGAQFPVETYIDNIDWIAVERVVANDRPLPELTSVEQRTATLLLAGMGRPADEIAVLVGASPRQVKRWKGQDAPVTKRCQLDGCERPLKARGLCCSHYQRHLNSLKPKAPKPPKTACRAGHAYPECLARRPNGKPYCLPCDRATRKAYRLRQAAVGQSHLAAAA